MFFCKIFGHKTSQHIDSVYGTLRRTHIVCTRCKITIEFRRATDAEAEEYNPNEDLDCGSNFTNSPYKFSE